MTTTRELLKQALQEMIDIAERVDGWESSPSDPIARAERALAAANAEEAKPAPEPVAWSYEEFEEFGDSAFFKPGWRKRSSIYEPQSSDTVRNIVALGPIAALPAPVDAQPMSDFLIQIRDDAYERAAKVCDGVNNHDNPMTSRDCADAIRAFKGFSVEPPTAKDAQCDRDALFDAWLSVGADLKGLSWNDFMDKYDAFLAANIEKKDVSLINEGDMRDKIREKALACGFKLKPQVDGTDDLNPYVYTFAEEILNMSTPSTHAGNVFENIGKMDMSAQPVQAEPSAAVPEGWRERLQEMRDASYTYSQYPELARVVFDSVIDALDELEAAAPAQQVQPAAQPASGAVDELPPLPDAIGMTLNMPNKYGTCEVLWSGSMSTAKKEQVFTADQMREYARAALSSVNQVNAELKAKNDKLMTLNVQLVNKLDIKQVNAAQPEKDAEDVLWELLNAVTDELNRRAVPGAWLSIAYNTGSAFITKRRAAIAAQPAKSEQRG